MGWNAFKQKDMATIKKFRSLISEPGWMNSLRSSHNGYPELKQALEARGTDGIGTGETRNVKSLINRFIAEKKFLYDEGEHLYLYEQISSCGSQFGLLALASVSDFLNGNIVGHEKTLEDRETRISIYRANVGLEGAPVLLTYRPNHSINEIIREIGSTEEMVKYTDGDIIHRIWQIEPKVAEQLLNLFNGIRRVYVGDGHHRLAAAAKMHNEENPQYVMALFVSSSNLKIDSFDRLIIPEKTLDTMIFLEKIKKLFYVSKVPGNIRYFPDRLHRLGMRLAGEWYQLDLKPDLFDLLQLPDVSILQEKVLAPFLEIEAPSTSRFLACFPRNLFHEMMFEADEHPGSIVFTVTPVSVHKLMDHSDSGKALPPKSSFIGPKVPYGLILNATALLTEEQAGKLN